MIVDADDIVFSTLILPLLNYVLFTYFLFPFMSLTHINFFRVHSPERVMNLKKKTKKNKNPMSYDGGPSIGGLGPSYASHRT